MLTFRRMYRVMLVALLVTAEARGRPPSTVNASHANRPLGHASHAGAEKTGNPRHEGRHVQSHGMHSYHSSQQGHVSGESKQNEHVKDPQRVTQEFVFSGFLGCRFSQSVCRSDEVCVDDKLFGSCQNIHLLADDEYQYKLSSHQLSTLEREVHSLIATGHTWRDLYTQCVLSNILLAYRLHDDFDPTFCDVAGKDGEHDQNMHELTRETLQMLSRILEESSDKSSAESVGLDRDDRSRHRLWRMLGTEKNHGSDFDVNGNTEADRSKLLSLNYDDDDVDEERVEGGDTELEKKSEFVNVHKYIHKNRKREPAAYSSKNDLSSYTDNEYRSILRSVTPEELRQLQEMVVRAYDDNDLDLDLDLENDGQDEGIGGDAREEEPPGRSNIEDNTLPVGQSYIDDKELSDYLKMKSADDENQEPTMSISHEDAKALEELLQGKLDVMSLNEAQVVRLTDYVSKLLADTDGISDNNVIDETPDQTEAIMEEEQLESLGNKRAIDHSAKHVPDNPTEKPATPEKLSSGGGVLAPKYELVDPHYVYLTIKPENIDWRQAGFLLGELQSMLGLSPESFSNFRLHNGDINFRINSNEHGLNATTVASLALNYADVLQNRTGLRITDAGLGHVEQVSISVTELHPNNHQYALLIIALSSVIAAIVLLIIVAYLIRRHVYTRQKLAQLAQAGDGGLEASRDYQDLCRQHMLNKLGERVEPLHPRIGSVSGMDNSANRSPSSRSSTSSWSEEPVTTNMDISTGHIVLSYMEDHMKNKDRLDEEWSGLCAYEPEACAVEEATNSSNTCKNRYPTILPYDHSRVILQAAANITGSDYINASTITDHDPRNPAYIATQGPMENTVADFWQMVWEQGSVVIVDLSKLSDQGVSMCHCYWPSESSHLYHIYEVHLVSEHIWCDDFLVRSFYLKNLQTSETRTVTQFHFVTWPDGKLPTSGAKALLDFRRKVNKSYRGRSCPIVVHCSDGVGRTGVYCLIDMVLNRLNKGAKEIDIAATLEHIRDQRMQMVKTKDQFEFVLAAVAEEVHAILKALPQ